MTTKIFLADLTHTHSGIQALTFPLGTAFVAAYAKHVLGEAFTFKLFKFPDALSKAIVEGRPRVLALSNYSWNLELGCKLAAWAKRLDPKLVVIMGGPNFSVARDEKIQFLKQRPVVDFYIEGEGEIGFSELLKKLEECDFDVAALKRSEVRSASCTYLHGDNLVEGGVQRIKDIRIIPSPYLTGIMDEFFELPLSPMLETTRGCPFTCAFCSDGLAIKNKVVAFEPERVTAELNYIAERVKYSDEINITDLNFGMYKEDIETARALADIQAKYNWPHLIKASAGKNKTERVLQAVDLLSGAWVVGSAVQSSDKEVLKNIKRSNISTDTFKEFIRYTHSKGKAASTFCEIILALPGDTKTKHFESLRFGIESNINVVKSYQAMLLAGTEMASPEVRKKYGFLTKFRVMAGGIGKYEFGAEEIPVAEIQEIIVGSNDMPFEDYVSCRSMSLILETYYNNGLSAEIFAALRAMGFSVFDFLVFLHEHTEIYTPKVKAIFEKFDEASRNNLYDSHEEAERVAFSPDMFDKYVNGDIGFNEVLECKTQLYFEMEETQAVLFRGLSMFLDSKGMLTSGAQKFLEELGMFSLCRKKRIFDCDLVIDHSFDYPFDEIDALDYAVDPRNVEISGQKKQFQFFHEPEQRDQISNAVSMYKNHPGGLSRVLYVQNLKKMYRNFKRV